MDLQHTTPKKNSFFDTIPGRTSFGLGFLTAILSLGTLGFLVLGGCMLSSGCNVLAANGSGSAKVAAVTGDAAGAAAAPVPTAAAGSVPVVTDEDHIRGNEDAKVTIIEYSDFECPFCSRFHPTVQQAMDEYGDDVRWVYRHFPLSFHPMAEPAAVASECAADQGKFWEFADALFSNQTNLGPDLYAKLAGDLGLNTNKFTDCLSDPSTVAKVQADAQGGATAGVTGTPGSFVIDEDGNAIPIKGAQPYSALKAAIDSVL
jgi:protein-disulfide isomerase